MSGAAAKAVRRDIRRAFGASAFDEIVAMRQELDALTAQLGAERTRIDDGLKLGTVADARIDWAHRRINWFESLTWWGRLRWLVRGH